MALFLHRFAMFATLFVAIPTTVYSQEAEQGPILRAVALPEPETPRTPSGCVLLKNDHVLFGQARQLGEFVIVQSSHGGEIRLGREQVACWAPTMRDLYQYRVDHRRRGNLAAHLRDARWCLKYDLLDLAAGELRSIYAIDPQNSEARQINQQLDRRVAKQTALSPSTLSPSTLSPSTDPSVRPVDYESDIDRLDIDRSDVGEAEVSEQIDGAALSWFAGKIQPMLVNRCANCHSERMAKHSEVRWRIFAPPTGARASAEFTKSNLQATLPYIDIRDPTNSPLLVYATSDHGGQTAPLTRRNAKAIDALQRWVDVLARTLNVDREAGSQSSGNLPAPSPAPTDLLQDQDPASNVTDPESGPARLPVVQNPFDPDLFNRRFHMKTDGRP